MDPIKTMPSLSQSGLNFKVFEATDLPDVKRIFREAFAPSRLEANLSRKLLGQGSEVDAHAWLARIKSLTLVDV